MNIGYFLIAGGICFIIYSANKAKTTADTQLPNPFSAKAMAQPVSFFDKLNPPK